MLTEAATKTGLENHHHFMVLLAKSGTFAEFSHLEHTCLWKCWSMAQLIQQFSLKYTFAAALPEKPVFAPHL